MNKRQFRKKVMAGVLSVCLATTMLTGCKNGLSKDDTLTKEGGFSQEEATSTKVMVIGDYDIYMDEIMFYAMQHLMMNKGTAEAVKATPDTYKDGVLSLIRTTKILYDVSLHNNVELTDEDLENTNKTIESFKSKIPKEILDKYGISDEVIERVFMEQTYVSKFENDIRNEMGKTANEDIIEKCKDYNFMVVNYIVFPIVETDENEEPAKDADGNYIYLSEDEKKAAHDNAEKIIEDLEAGGDVDELITSYGVGEYSQEMSGYVGAFSENMNKALEDLKAGECAEIIENDLGYVVLYVKTDHDQDLLESYAYVVANDVIEDQFTNLENQWLSTIEVDPEKDMEGTVWADYDLLNLATDLENNGLIK